ncbi:tetratricopeptide repeat protein [Streptomyces sp. NPDC048357]|uniref:tetratricopeptide repeat protein n=1 Tax=Streptomyces sp. NPDC048357 TaxID=3154719 RepID=UPI00344551EA
MNPPVRDGGGRRREDPGPAQVRVRGSGAVGAGGDVKGNAFGDGSIVHYVENQNLHEAVAWREPAWPVLMGVVPARAGYYEHRPQAGELVAALETAGSVQRCQVVTGTGGVGKTQLAAEYARTALDGSGAEPVELLLWIQATGPHAVAEAYALAAQAVVPGGACELLPNQAAQQFLAWLRTTTRRWLIVLDDAPAPGALAGLWPPEVAAGRVLVTTRSRDAAWSTETRTLLQVDMFTPDQSAAYLRRALARPGRPARGDRDSDISGLADALGHLPLALAQAAAYLVDTGREIPQYRMLLGDRARLLARLVPDIGGLPDAQTRTVNAVWDISLALADTYRPVGLAGPMMELAAVLDANAVPGRILTARAARARLAALRASDGGTGDEPDEVDEVDEVDAEDALRTLHRLNLLDHDPGAATVRIHQLIQRAVREGARARLRDLVSTAADAVMEVWPDPERDSMFALALRANAEELIGHGGGVLWEDGAHPLLFRVGGSRGDSGEVQGAVEHYEKVAADAHARLGADHPDTLAARHEEAYWRGQTGDVAGTLAAFQRLLTDQLRLQGPDHPHTLTVRNEVAHWRGQSGDVAGALAAMEELLVDHVRLLEPDDPRTLTTRGNIAGWRGESGDVAGAIAGYEELLADRLRVLGPDHPSTLSSRSQLAHWRGESGDLTGAVAGYEELLADQLRVLGPDHPDLITTRNNLAATRGYTGDAAGAAAAFEDLLAACERVLGGDHPHTLTTRGNLAFWRGEVGDLEGAYAAYRDLLADRLRLLGPDHRDTFASRNDLAGVQGELGDAAGAAAAYERLLEDRLRTFGADHPDTLATRSNLAGWRGEAGDLRASAAGFEELLADQLRVLGPDHPDTLVTRNNLASLRGRAGDIAGAVTAYRDLVADLTRVLGADHPSTLRACGNLAGWQADLAAL